MPLTLVQISRIHGGKKQFMRGGSKKAQVSNLSMGMSWGAKEKCKEGILLKASSEPVNSVNI